MPKKSNKIQIGDLWRRKDRDKNLEKYNDKIYIVVDIIKHPFFSDSVTLKRIDCMDGGSYNISVQYLKEDYRKLV